MPARGKNLCLDPFLLPLVFRSAPERIPPYAAFAILDPAWVCPSIGDESFSPGSQLE
jgi:hypothetical protein